MNILEKIRIYRLQLAPHMMEREGVVLLAEARDEIIRLTNLTEKLEGTYHKHVFYKTGDHDAPRTIMDRNSDVVLQLCRFCGRAEVELTDPVCSRTRFYAEQEIFG